MPPPWRHSLLRLARRTTLLVVVVGLAILILLPIYFLVALSLMSDREVYQEKPLPLVPALSNRFRLDASAHGLRLSRYNPAAHAFRPLIETSDLETMAAFATRQTNSRLTVAELRQHRTALAGRDAVRFTRPKSLWANYRMFFRVANDRSGASIWRSATTALATIAISLVLGSLAGYAFARYRFRGRQALKVGVLFVRMYPGVAIAIPMVILLGHLGLYDQPLGLSLVYAVGQIGLTVWITASIFLSIPPEFEEAAQIFGTTRAGAFWHVTLPLALPGLAACAMYGFITAWNETLQAVVLTQAHPTFAVVVYQALVGEASDMVNFAAAGGVAMAAPAVLFTLMIRKYILRMWGSVDV